MKEPIKTTRDGKKQTWLFRGGIFITALLALGMITAIARYKAHDNSAPAPATQTSAASAARSNFVPVEVAGKKLQVNAQTLQQGPLTPEQAQQIAAALKDNQSSDGLVQ